MKRFLFLSFLSSLGDNLSTYLGIRFGLVEANPVAAIIVNHYPLWVWFLRDLLGFGVVLLLYVCVRDRWSKAWVVPGIPIVAKICAAIHNMFLLVPFLFG